MKMCEELDRINIWHPYVVKHRQADDTFKSVRKHLKNGMYWTYFDKKYSSRNVYNESEKRFETDDARVSFYRKCE